MAGEAASNPLWLGAATAFLLLAGAPAAAQDRHQGLHERAAEMFPRSAEFDFEAPVPGSYRLPVIKAAPDGTVLTEGGEVARLHDLTAGRVSVLSFIYTRCSDEKGCPLSTGLLHDIQMATHGHDELAGKLRLISLSFDPRYDTPETMAMYGAAYGADTENAGVPWTLLTTRGEAELRPILEGYGQTIDRATDPYLDAASGAGPGIGDDGTGVIYHLLRVYLIDARGRIRNIYGLGFLDPRLLIADILTLLMEPEDSAAD